MAAAAASSALTLPDWQNAAKHVEQLASATAASGSTGAGIEALGCSWRIVEVVDSLRQAGSASMTNATWRKMVAKKVPQQIAAACARVVSNILLSGSGSGTSSPAAQTGLSLPRTAAAPVLEILNILTRRAQADLSSQASAEATAFRQQIEQSGFLQLLPQLFASLVECLQAETGLSTHLNTASQSAASGTGDSSSSSSSMNCRHGAVNSTTAFVLAAAATATLRTYAQLSASWPLAVFVTEVAPGCTAAALQLCWLSFQQVSARLPPPGTQATDQLLCTVSEQWYAAAAAANTILMPVAADSDELAALLQRRLAQHKARVLASPHALPCLAFMLTAGVYDTLLAQLSKLPRLRTAPGGGSSSGGGSSGSSRLSGPAAAWELACKQLASVPGAHSMLLQQLGCGPLAPLFCAAMHSATGNSAAVGRQPGSSSSSSSSSSGSGSGAQRAACIDTAHMQQVANVAIYNQLLDGDGSAVHPATSTAQRQLHLLLSPVLFYWAAHQPARLDGGAPADCMVAVRCGMRALAAAQSDPDDEGFAPPDWLLQLVRAEVTPLISAVAASVLGSLGCTSIPTPGATASSGGTSSSSTSSSRKPSERATATSTTPCLTVLHLAVALDLLSAIPQLPMLCAQLLEAAVRGWQQDDASIDPDFVELADLLATLISCSCTSSASGSTYQPTSQEGALVAAAQVQHHKAPQDSDVLSPEQLQLASLCCSVLKVLSAAWEADPSLQLSEVLVSQARCCEPVAQAATSMLHWLATAAGAESAAGSSSTQRAAAAAAPWLVLSGRILQFVAPHMTPAFLSGATGFQEFASNIWLRRSAHTAMAGLRVWLLAQGAAEGLSAAGYDPSGSALQQLQAACGAAGPTASPQLPEPETLQSLSQALSTLPFACACNHPACTNLTGPLELQLVNGKSCMCGGCRVAHYCSRACQMMHWSAHRPVCKATAAARQQAAAAAAGATATASC